MTVAAPDRSLFRSILRSVFAKAQNPKGLMAALYLPTDVAASIALPGGTAPADLHLTLKVFADDAAEVPAHKLERIAADLEQIANRTPVLVGRVSGVGRFNGDQAGGEDVTYATLDLPGLMSLAQDVRWCGYEVTEHYRDEDEPEHDFTPHVTLAYGEVELPDVPTTEVRVDRLTLAIGSERREYLFAGAGDQVEKAEWTTAYVNDLPDSSFAIVLPGGEKDDDGRTTPRSLRKLPYKDADGAVDLPHLRNALARLASADLTDEQRASAERKLKAAASSNLEKAADPRAEAIAAAVGEMGWLGQVEVSPYQWADSALEAVVWKAAGEDGAEQLLVDDGDVVVTLAAWADRIRGAGIRRRHPRVAGTGAPVAKDATGEYRVFKRDGAQRFTLGVAYPARRTTEKADAHGDYMDADELEAAAWSFLASGAKGSGTMHLEGTDGAGTIVESYIYRGPTWKVDGQTIDAGDWMLGVIWDEPSWTRIEAGELTGYSMQGVATRETA